MTEKYKNWHIQTDDKDIVWCHLDKHGSSTNVLSAQVLAEFDSIVSMFENNIPRGVVILSDKSNGFIAGADIVEFTKISEPEQAREMIKRVHNLFNRLQDLSCPTLSLINGFCLGGGLELALACRYRIALDDPKTRIGLPEVKLGIFPGFGGTMRLIHLIGAFDAMQLMLTGRSVDANKAKKLGIVDRAVPKRQFRNAAIAMILQQPPTFNMGIFKKFANHALIRPLLTKFLRREISKRVSPEHYPAPFALLDHWQHTGQDKHTMLINERDVVSKLITTETSRNLVRVYLLQERLKSFGSDKSFTAKHVHVIGAGVMGGDIAAWCVLQGYTVTLQDRAPEYIAPAIKRAYVLFKKRLKISYRINAAMDRLIPDVKAYGIAVADVVIEAIVENAEAKIELFKDIEKKIKDEAILATNTSSIPLDDLSQHLQEPQRLVGIHFFNPVAQMQLVEIIHSPKTAAEWIKKAATFCRGIDRLPLQVKSSPGFLVNRILMPYLLETVTLLEEGNSAVEIDKVAKQFGMPLGPVELADTVGLDVCLSVAENLSAMIYVSIPDKLRDMVNAKRLGRKTGKGFYEYKKGRPLKRAISNDNISSTDIEDRLILRILNECVACLREQLVDDADLLDAGMIFGTGFAPFRGGPLHYARQQGASNIVERLRTLQQKHGDRFAPDKAWDSKLDI